jgi:DNA-binding response OmpR family regulator
VKILVVDDEPGLLQLLKGWLVDAGHVIVTARGGEEALYRVRAEPFDRIVLDQCLAADPSPLWRGCDVLKAIREGLRQSAPPVILLCAKGAGADRGPWCENLPREAASYLYKPFDRGELISLIENPRPGELPIRRR